MNKDISFPKHLGIEVESKEELIKLVEEAVKKDKGVYYTIDEVRQHMKEQYKLAKAILKDEKAKAKARLQVVDLYEIKFTETFYQDLDEIFWHIFTELKSPFAAQDITEAIIKKCYFLKLFPKSSPIKMMFRGEELRFAHIKKYIIIYYIKKKTKTVYIHRAVYCRRDISAHAIINL